jgi:protein-L-isoaspartate(D-aspartate) O-methyltransferase
MAFEAARARMVEEQLKARGITAPRVLQACATVPRHLFVPRQMEGPAYGDHPIPIGHGQTVSQPYIVALMTQLLRLQGHERVLEIGTGSGYQSAILAEVALEVYSVERHPELAEAARQRLERLGYRNVQVTAGDGSVGWLAHAPYEGVLVTAGASRLPPALVEQVAENGRLVMPIGSPQAQMLTLVERHRGTLRTQAIASCVFVPLIGHDPTP